MVPLLHDGDFLVVRKVLWFSDIRTGNIVTVKHPQFGQIVKAIISVTPETVQLTGLSRMSASIDALGDVKRESIDGVGIAIISRRAKNDSNPAWLRFLKNNDLQRVLA